MLLYRILYPKAGVKVSAIVTPRYRDDVGVVCRANNMTVRDFFELYFERKFEFETNDQTSEAYSLRRLEELKLIYVFTDELMESKEKILNTFASTGMRCIIVDDSIWSSMTMKREPDFFISHDSRDKEVLAKPMYCALLNLGFNVWMDKFSITPGDDLFEKIDMGLTECKYGIILLTKNFLQNEGWARKEFTTLMSSRIFRERKENSYSSMESTRGS